MVATNLLIPLVQWTKNYSTQPGLLGIENLVERVHHDL